MPRFLLPLIAMLATMAASILLVRKAVAWGFIDIPDDRKVHALPTPRTGGLAMVLGGGLVFILSQAFGWLPMLDLPWQTWLAGLGFVAVGAVDDRFSFHPRQKFLVFLSLSALAAGPWIMALRATGVSWLPQPWTSSPITIIAAAILLTFWFMAVPNAVNIEDAINGYMGGYTFIMMVTAALYGVDTYIVIGTLMGFLLLNWPKAKHFLGDAGSFGCGFLIAENLLRAGGAKGPIMAILLTAPISLDVAMGIFRRIRLGMSLFDADRSTLPHHVLALFKGSHTSAAIVLWSNAIIVAFLIPHPGLAFAYLSVFLIILICLNWASISSSQSRYSP